jgi:hypothetical protein
MKNEESQYFDFKRLKSPNADKRGRSKSTTKKAKGSEEPSEDTAQLDVKDTKDMTIWQKVKYFAAKRYRKGAVKHTRYTELALKYFMGGQKAGDELKMSFDEISKSDSSTFGAVLQDFMHL